jgi:hypothetical protein
MPIVPTNLQTEYFRRHFTVAWCKCHNHRWIYRRIYSIGISHSPKKLPRVIIRRHLIGSWKIFAGYATITDGVNPSIYFKREFFFWRAIFVYKTIGNFFFTDRCSDEIRYYRWKESRRTISVRDVIGKKVTDELWITDRQNSFVGKTVKACSVQAPYFLTNLF